MIHHPVVVNKAGQAIVSLLMYSFCSCLARAFKRLILAVQSDFVQTLFRHARGPRK
jgi:hypothetical protein